MPYSRSACESLGGGGGGAPLILSGGGVSHGVSSRGAPQKFNFDSLLDYLFFTDRLSPTQEFYFLTRKKSQFEGSQTQIIRGPDSLWTDDDGCCEVLLDAAASSRDDGDGMKPT